MADKKKLDRWAEKLLDTGKRNNLISFKDTKASSAEVVHPNCETVFSKCSVGRVFEVFDPKIPEEDLFEEEIEQSMEEENKKLTREEYIERYSPRLRGDKYLLVYSQTPNPLTAVKNIAKKAKEMQDETGINVAYLAFGFIRWNEKEGSEVFYRAPLLLVHVNLITGSVIDPIKIEVNDDDVVVNPTFAYFLQAEYGLTLPAFEDEDTLSTYYEKVGSSVKKLGWEILNECKLGIFSFLKINMYEDLKNNAQQILENDNVRMLLGESVSSALPSVGTETTVQNPLIDLHTVIDADSSQIEAIEMAKSGKSFVLQGPPGTGKSQTITNIIAECLHDGKKVLFVSEKQAALNVVYDKLKKAGLEDFCLELHSHKANKKAVIEELNRTLETPKSAVSSRAQEEIRQKQAAQKKLDTYAAALHEKRDKIDKSLYQLFELYSAERNYPELKIAIRNIQMKGQDYLLQAVKLLEQYAEYTASVGQNYRQNAWYGFSNLQISYDARNYLKADMEKLAQGYRQLQSTTTEIQQKYETPELNYTDTQLWQKILAFSAESDVITPSLLSREAYQYALPYLNNMKAQSEVIVPARDYILASFEPKAIEELDGKGLYTRLNGQFSSGFTRMFSGDYKHLIASVQVHLKGGGKLKYRQAVDFAESLMKLQSAREEYNKNEAAIPGCLGSCYRGPDTDWDHVMSAMNTLQGFFAENALTFGAISKMNMSSFAESQAKFRADSVRLNDEMTAIAGEKSRIAQQFMPEVLNFEKHGYDYCARKLEACLADFEKLGNWISFMGLLQQLQAADLQDFVDLLIEKQIEPQQMTGAYRRAFYKHWIEYILFSVPELASFTRIKQDQAVLDFVAKDSLQYEISKVQIKSELSQARPSLDIVTGGSAVAILRREGQKRRKQMPIRKLLSETGSLVQIIKPCFLMSPLSVSTFLDPEKISFDTIVFDEASQIFPQDAIGAIYRGKQLIVVGDSRQMPPSNFFNSSVDIDDDDEEVGDINDFDSILDICSSVFTTERLAWHYRSHYEQLIAFSNFNFYNNTLVTFPSSSTDHKGVGVDFYYVDGVFDRKSKTNRIEAEFIVDLIYQNIQDHPNRSLGVVAFSVAQQNMIDKLLSKRREADPSYEWFFKADCAEPFFIKNLETVQGDERDTIIFSVAYAKDSQGRFIQNFGPLNRVGGERRLNVAVTRAKDNVQLVASIHYSDINLSNTGSEGVRLLRAYLDYAQNGEQALERAITASEQDQFDSYFEQEVCDLLRNNGYTVDTQVGCSGYRIDLGLRNPDSSNYLLAIECDGATYHNSRNARDRDSLRQRVLENMGWTFYRIWSTDWYRNPTVEKERLLQAAKNAVSKAKEPEKKQEQTIKQDSRNLSEKIEERFVTTVQEDKLEFPKYKELNALQVIYRYPHSLLSGVKEILETEAPLSEEYLLRRIVSIFGREKVTSVVTEEFNRRMFRCERMGVIRKNGFLYLQEMGEIRLRIPGDRREIKHISIEELADGFYTLISQNVTASKEGLYKTMTNLLGFSRTGEAIVMRFDAALQYLKRSERIEENGSEIRASHR